MAELAGDQLTYSKTCFHSLPQDKGEIRMFSQSQTDNRILFNLEKLVKIDSIRSQILNSLKMFEIFNGDSERQLVQLISMQGWLCDELRNLM